MSNLKKEMKDMDFEAAFTIARTKIEELPIGTEFFVKDLFDGTYWNAQDPGKRRYFGREFKRRCTTGQFPGIIPIASVKKESQKYQRTEDK